MTKDILLQYCDLKEEVKELHARVQRLDEQIKKIESSGAVIDCVKGGSGGIQNFLILGFPYPEYTRKKTLLTLRIAKLQAKELEYLELTNEVDDYINELKDSRIRRILRFKFIDDMTWIKVAANIGGKATDESVRKEFERFYEKEESLSVLSV